MKVCFPVEIDNGLESLVFGHFGSAPAFIIVDTDTDVMDTIHNQDLGHSHGMCSPIKALNGKMVDAIIAGGIGAGAVSKLNGMGIRVYRAQQGTIRDNLTLFKSTTMSELTTEHACGGHGADCGH